jgi:hypothetical protein
MEFMIDNYISGVIGLLVGVLIGWVKNREMKKNGDEKFFLGLRTGYVKGLENFYMVRELNETSQDILVRVSPRNQIDLQQNGWLSIPKITKGWRHE